MTPRLLAAPVLDQGMLKSSATLQDPEVRLVVWDGMPTLAVEEGGVSLELEFPDAESFARFQQRVAELRPADAEPAEPPFLPPPTSEEVP